MVFAGTLMLQKGVQYIYEALHKRPDLPVQMEFFGPVNLTPLGVRRLAEVGTVHGAVPRSRLLEEFRRADVLLFPSLSEGSALVTLEATALGLPVVATEETGAPASAMVIPRVARRQSSKRSKRLPTIRPDWNGSQRQAWLKRASEAGHVH